jgi:hypothetical protein
MAKPKIPERKKTSLNLSKSAKDHLSLLKVQVRQKNLPEDIEVTESSILEALILAATPEYAAAKLKK